MRLLSIVPCAFLLLVSADATAAPPKPVRVTNFPATQHVAGAVEVTNLPAVQKVEVTNAAPPAACARFQLVGFTTATPLGDAGILGFTAACEAELPGSRMCTSVEVMETVHPPASLVTAAWVRPVVLVPGGADASGVSATGFGSCDGWNQASVLRALTVSAIGSFATGGCDEPKPVACCAPTE